MVTKTLGVNSAQLLTKLAAKNKHVFTVADAQEILGVSYNATLLALRRLTEAGWLVRLMPGHYAIVPLSSGDIANPQINRYVIGRELMGETPYYFSHESALDIHNILTRPVTRVIVTTTRRLKERKILNVPYRFVYASQASIWGYDLHWVTPYEQVYVSDLERTILDCINRPELCAGISQLAVGLWIAKDDIEWDLLGHYAQKIGRNSVAQRLGYLLELFDLGSSSLIEDLQRMVASHYVNLDPMLPDQGPYISRWRLRLNIEPDSLESIVRT